MTEFALNSQESSHLQKDVKLTPLSIDLLTTETDVPENPNVIYFSDSKEYNMFGLGMTELFIIMIIILIIFGAGKLPGVGSGIGKGIRNFKKAVSNVDDNTQNHISE